MRISWLLLGAWLPLAACSTSTSLLQPAKKWDYRLSARPLVNREEARAAESTPERLKALDGVMLVITIIY